MRTTLKWKRSPDYPDALKPHRAHPTDSGADVFAAHDVDIKPGEKVKIATGIRVQVVPHFMEPGYTGEVPKDYNVPGGWTFGVFAWDKSGRGDKGLKTLGGVVDNPYTGDVAIHMTYVPTAGLWDNLIHMMKTFTFLPSIATHMESCRPVFKIAKGEKLCQIVVQRVELPLIPEDECTDVWDTDRGENGHGSTGLTQEVVQTLEQREGLDILNLP